MLSLNRLGTSGFACHCPRTDPTHETAESVKGIRPGPLLWAGGEAASEWIVLLPPPYQVQGGTLFCRMQPIGNARFQRKRPPPPTGAGFFMFQRKRPPQVLPHAPTQQAASVLETDPQENGMTEGMNDSVAETLRKAGYYVKNIFDDPACMQTWKSRWIHICNHDDDVIQSLRLYNSKIGIGELPSRKTKDAPLNFVDPDTGWVFVSPTTHNKTGMSIAECIKMAQRTKAQNSQVRVSVITSEDDGVVCGFDLGIYRINLIDSKNFFHLEPMSKPDDCVSDDVTNGATLMGRKTFYNGRCYESEGEARLAVLLDHIGVPFQYEKREQEISLASSLLQANVYRVDFILWPDDFRRMCYLEWKRHLPTLEEQEKMTILVKEKGVVGYIAWGKHFQQSIKWSTRGKEDRSDVDGVRLMKFAPVVDNRGRRTVRRTEGYYMALNDNAVGREWEEVQDANEGKDQQYDFNVSMLRRHLLCSCKKISKTKWSRMMLPGRVKVHTRVVAGGRHFKPTDASTLSFRRNPMHEDCTCDYMQKAFRVAANHTFDVQMT